MSAAGYSLIDYGDMVSKGPRMDAFVEALRRSISEGCRVVDLGSGPGAFALVACQLGAGSVVAIEPDASIKVAQQAARDNGYDDRISFERVVSTAWQPDQRADVVVSDVRGSLPLYQFHIPTVVDLRDRILAPGGVQIPGLDRIFAALVEAPETHRRYDTPWRTNDYGIDFRAGLEFVTNARSRVYIDSEAPLLTEPQLFATLDYRTVTEINHSASLSFRTTRAGTAHGLVMWFETELVPGVGYSNAPGQPELVYGQTFFPLTQALDVNEGSDIGAYISATLVDGDYVWGWNVEATDRHGQTHRFRQSTFKADIPDPAKLAARASGFRPPVRPTQHIDAWLLQRFDGQTELATLAQELITEFPEHFATERAAFNHAAELSARYNR